MRISEYPRIALLVETSTAYGRGILAGIAKYARERCTWSVGVEERALDSKVPDWLESVAWDGIICRATTPSTAARLRAIGVPIIDLNDLYEDLGFWRISSDHRAIGKLGAEYFLGHGFHRLAFVGLADRLWSRLRGDGFEEASAQAGIEASSLRFPSGDDDESLWRASLERWLESIDPGTGILACNDVFGRLVLQACARLGICVPDDAAVLGVDDETLLCEFSYPTLSSVRPNTELIGYLAAAELDAQISGRAPPLPRLGGRLVSPVGVVSRLSTDTCAFEDPAVSDALRFIRMEAGKGCTVDDVLSAVPVSRSVLERRFRKFVGRSPGEEIWAVRISRIKELLRETDLKLSAIAELCGIEYPEYLSVAFKRETGMTPGEYRLSTRIA